MTCGALMVRVWYDTIKKETAWLDFILSFPLLNFQDLGVAMGVKRGSLMVLVKEHNDYMDLFNECREDMKTLPIPCGVN